MKNWYLAFLLSGALFIAPSCKNEKKETRADEKNVITPHDIPAIINTAFTSKYPGASEVIWEDAHEGDDPTFKVKFKKDGKYWKAEFKSDGSFVKEKEDE